MRLARRLSRGFTLLELLVVLAIMGLISAVAAPQLITLSDRVAFALNREMLERALAALPYEAYKRREDLILGAVKKSELSETPESVMVFNLTTEKKNETLVVEAPVLLISAQLPIPEGWKLELKSPVIYRSTGFCTGGEVDIKIGGLIYSYELKAPQCVPELK